MAIKHVLFVDDDPGQQDLFEDAIAEWNQKNTEKSRKFDAEIASTVEEANELLRRKRYDAALFDLRVKTTGQLAKSAGPTGNDLAKRALATRGIPVAIMTADESVLEDEVRNAGNLEVFDKNEQKNQIGGPYDNAVDWFASQWEMMDVIDAAKLQIDSSVASVFLRRLWPLWSDFADLDDAEHSQLSTIVTRQFVTHLAELLGIDSPENVTWHPYENYIQPALLEDRAHTGDIFRFQDQLWVVLTPQCDMATQKVENVILAYCALGIDQWDEKLATLREGGDGAAAKKATKFFMNHVNQSIENSKHFLPPLPNSQEPILVHFSNIRTVRLEDLNSSLVDRIASISPSFLSNIVQRFGSYISRMGQPNIDINRL